MNECAVRLDPHPQDISLCMRIYFKSLTYPKLETLQFLSTSYEGCSAYIEIKINAIGKRKNLLLGVVGSRGRCLEDNIHCSRTK